MVRGRYNLLGGPRHLWITVSLLLVIVFAVILGNTLFSGGLGDERFLPQLFLFLLSAFWFAFELIAA